jgi:hypothetical protein
MSDKIRIAELLETWSQCKQVENQAVETRRAIEDEISALVEINPSTEGTVNFELGKYKVKIVSRLNRKVDADKLQEIAIEAGLTAHLSDLFRWKPELEMKAWKAADQSITSVLIQAVTTTAGRPSYSISFEE